MNTETFIQKRDELISKIKELDLYKEYKKLDSLIYEDKIIQELNKKKEKLLQDYKFASEDLQNKILQEILSVQKEIEKQPLVIRYNKIKKELKELVEPLNTNIIQKVYFWILIVISSVETSSILIV